eukprot:maker-scaffold39_size501901-snap-gene-1.16 protein:Tk00979 transcript:maker-scaffold39_size501901-snap-gene-1.16-mRNA-1 annotation:"PREDICTED: uncharacterized protein LOC100875476"
MAFLCPVRIKRNKKKKPLHDDSLQGPVPSMGRITGSASIETLVRVGIEKENGLGPESKMVVLHDFTPCVDDELEVKRGQIVHVLYQENDWVYVISEENKEGFIPHSYCAHFGSQLAGLALNVKKKLPRDASAPFGLGGSGGGPGKSTSMNGLPQMGLTSPGLPSSASSGKPPQLDLTSGTATTASSKALEQTDSDNSSLLRQNHPMGPGSVPGMLSTNGHRSHQSQPLPLPHNDPSRSNSLMSETSSQPDIHPFYKEPAGRFIVLYTYQAQDENDLSVDRGQCVTVLNSDDPDWCWVSNSSNGNSTLTNGGEGGGENRFGGTELVMLYDYKAQAPDDLSVRRGDWVYADLSNQTVDGWLWSYSPKTRKYGFIPRAYARPPAMTSL